MPNAYGAIATPPTLGYGQRGEAPIDAVNQWMRAQPWYQQLLQSFGQNPNNVHLNDSQKQAVIRAAQANGVVVDEGHNGQEVDDSGNFQAKSHALRNTLIVAGLAGAALLTAGAAGAFGGAAAGGGAGATAGGTAAATGGTLAASATVPTVGALAAGGTGLAATAGGVGAGTAATIGGGVAASKGVSSWLLPALGIGANVAGNLAGATIQSNAAKDAAQIQADTAAKALDFEKNQYGTLMTNLSPYIAAGTTSSDRQAQLLGLPPRAGTTATAAPTYGPSIGAAPVQTQPVARTAATPEPMITLAKPDGVQGAPTMQVPQSQVAYWVSKGAKQVAA